MKRVIKRFTALAFGITMAINFPFNCVYAEKLSTNEVYELYKNNQEDNSENNIEKFASFCVDYFGLENVEPAKNIYKDLSSSADDVLRLVALNYIKGTADSYIGKELTEDRAYIILSRILKDYSTKTNTGAILPPNVKKEMCSPEYWINKAEKPYKLLLNREKINELNKAIINADGTNMSILEDIAGTFDGIKMANELASFASPDGYYIDGKAVSEQYYEAIRQNILNANVDTKTELKYGFATNYTVMKAYPYDDFITDDVNDAEWDSFTSSGINCNEPIVVYFFTADKQFAYVRSSICSGWVSSKDIAICSSKQEWQNAKQMDKFIVVTGNRVYLEPSNDDTELSEKLLTMGTVLKLKTPSNTDERIINRLSWNNYVVAIPARNSDGSYYEKTALISMNRDVNEGYLDFTQAGIVKQAFKCLGDRYGWGGMLKSPDCSAYVLNVYKCFGINLPRNTVWQSLMPVKIDKIDELTAEEKAAALANAPMGSIIQFKGHEMIFLGEDNGKLYTINDVNFLKNPNNVEAGGLTVNSVIVNELSAIRGNEHTWFEDMNKIITPWKKVEN